MTKFARIATLAALCLGLGTSFAYAQGGAGFVPQLYGGTIMMISPDGHIQTMKMVDQTMMSKVTDMMMKDGHVASEPMLIMLGSDGKVHMMADAKMKDGTMLSQHLKP